MGIFKAAVWAARTACKCRGTAKLRLPPALKPLIAVRDISRPRDGPCSQIQRMAEAQSSMAVGKGCSGARRYSTLTTTASLDRELCSATAVAQRASSEAFPTENPPP
jgi:hypothetical protein